ncbi:MAG: hypothetical protein HC770_02760 [Pseudanabaena sp. CRU_2_10]|nr:hypothetical protein [Pseudanabaena sp. CRU_2_10]
MVKNTRLSSLIPKNVHPVQAEIFFLLEVPAMFISAPVNRTKRNLNKNSGQQTTAVAAHFLTNLQVKK